MQGDLEGRYQCACIFCNNSRQGFEGGRQDGVALPCKRAPAYSSIADEKDQNTLFPIIHRDAFVGKVRQYCRDLVSSPEAKEVKELALNLGSAGGKTIAISSSITRSVYPVSCCS